MKVNTVFDIERIKLQFMPGIRGNTPVFGKKCKFGYGALRLGYGMELREEFFGIFCLEAELGLNFHDACFIGVLYQLNKGNWHNYLGHIIGLRLGFNFGKYK
jgi:hypothetical protein